MNVKKGFLMKSSQPWYENAQYWFDKANDYIVCYHKAKNSKMLQDEIGTFALLNTGRVIFESNLIEGAGLSEQATRRLILEDFPKIPADFKLFKQLQSKNNLFRDLLAPERLEKMLTSIKNRQLDPKKIRPSISMEGKSRGYREVAQHYIAMQGAKIISLEYLVRKILRDAYIFLISKNKSETAAIKIVRNLYDRAFDDEKDFRESIISGEKKVTLFTEDNIKALHVDLAEGLLPQDSQVGAGKYRIDTRIVGWDILFPDHTLVPMSMMEFIKRADQSVESALFGKINFFEAAATISYEFVEIHPFPDFNGRLSRILMNTILMVGGCPFPVSLRGRSKEKHRYFISLRRANRGNLTPLASLIAMRTAETFAELDRHLELAGLDRICPRK